VHTDGVSSQLESPDVHTDGVSSQLESPDVHTDGVSSSGGGGVDFLDLQGPIVKHQIANQPSAKTTNPINRPTISFVLTAIYISKTIIFMCETISMINYMLQF
jgi:hypothetical protein